MVLHRQDDKRPKHRTHFKLLMLLPHAAHAQTLKRFSHKCITTMRCLRFWVVELFFDCSWTCNCFQDIKSLLVLGIEKIVNSTDWDDAKTMGTTAWGERFWSNSASLGARKRGVKRLRNLTKYYTCLMIGRHHLTYLIRTDRISIAVFRSPFFSFYSQSNADVRLPLAPNRSSQEGPQATEVLSSFQIVNAPSTRGSRANPRWRSNSSLSYLISTQT